jgi:hypothetical protein
VAGTAATKTPVAADQSEQTLQISGTPATAVQTLVCTGIGEVGAVQYPVFGP